MRGILSIFIFLSWSCSSQNINDSIVLINVGTEGRERVAELLNHINQHEPKVTAIDLQFSSEKSPEVDKKLIDALSKCNNLVMVSVIENYSTQRLSHDKFIPGCLPKFTSFAKTGFVNLIIEDDEFSTVKRFSIWEYVDGIKELSFAMQTAYAFDKDFVAKYELTHNQFNEVNFKNGLSKFKRYSIEDILSMEPKGRDLNGKILMIGFLGPGNSDKFYTPISTNDIPGEPNIYGLEFLAQVVAQILQR